MRPLLGGPVVNAGSARVGYGRDRLFAGPLAGGPDRDAHEPDRRRRPAHRDPGSAHFRVGHGRAKRRRRPAAEGHEVCEGAARAGFRGRRPQDRDRHAFEDAAPGQGGVRVFLQDQVPEHDDDLDARAQRSEWSAPLREQLGYGLQGEVRSAAGPDRHRFAERKRDEEGAAQGDDGDGQGADRRARGHRRGHLRPGLQGIVACCEFRLAQRRPHLRPPRRQMRPERQHGLGHKLGTGQCEKRALAAVRA
mmetsp:Transcript_8597/g.25627  ORF Transcript_8597/g.25627 Transcript_8597/m.25627 type:complete len:249 (-) Transcript_8597:162-908(-)